MPTNRRKVIRSRIENKVSMGVLNYLRYGNSHDLEVFVLKWRYPNDRGPFKKYTGTLKDRWGLARAAIMNEWKCKPGQRPYGWWLFDSPHNDPWDKEGCEFLLMGRYALKRAEFYSYENDTGTRVESQAAFLKRHHLLTKSEEKRLKPADYEPVLLSTINEMMKKSEG